MKHHFYPKFPNSRYIGQQRKEILQCREMMQCIMHTHNTTIPGCEELLKELNEREK